ncbi:MAG: helix-turn-helix transcriptional regulator [Chthoniobacteraceae bacterium]
MDRLVDIKEVAERFGVSVRGVWRLVSKGELPVPVKVGNLSRWCESELEAVFEEKKRQRIPLCAN